MIPLTPKQRLRLSESDRLNVEKLITDDLAALLQLAFTEFCYNLPAGDNPAKAWDASCRLEGAKRYLETILTLADKAPPPGKPMGSGTLLPDGQQPGMVFQPLKP